MNKVLVTLTGPTCSGKSSLEKSLVKMGFEAVISCTTRPRRDGEVDGVDYNFLTQSQFDSLVEKGFMAEHARFDNQSYGTELNELERCFATDKPVVLVIEPDGRKQIEAQALKRGWSLIKVFIDIKRHKQLHRFLSRFAVDIMKASDADDAMLNTYTNRLYQLQVMEQSWISEAYRWNRPYDLLIDRYDEQTGEEVEVMIQELAAISRLQQLTEEREAA